ncbi:MAG: ABC transporter permease [Anaerolineaceae bacterium]
MSPLDMRVSLFMPGNVPLRILLDEEAYGRLRDRIIEQNHLNDSFPTQYGIWLSNFVTHNWGYSPSLGQEVLPALLDRSPATAELTIYSMLLIIPLTLFSGIQAARKKDKPTDLLIRGFSMAAGALPLFIMAFFLMTVFYINLKWSSLTGLDLGFLQSNGSFHPFTGLMTVDGLLNGRMDITLTAIRRLMLPVLTITASQWALLTRITRSATIEELQKDYVLAARSRGASTNLIIGRHVLKNTLNVFLANTALSAASIVTGVFIVERIFLWPGVSDILFRTGSFVPDASAVIGFTIYSVIVVLFIMLILDLLQASINPLISEEMIGSSDGQ